MAEDTVMTGERPTRVCSYCMVMIERGGELRSHGICPACEEQLATREGYALRRCDDHRLLDLGDRWERDPDLARLFGARDAARDYLRAKAELTVDLNLRVVRAQRSVVLARRGGTVDEARTTKDTKGHNQNGGGQ